MSGRPSDPAASLQRLFSPKTIAIVGASARETSFGARTAANLSQFRGRLYLVNPGYKEINGEVCYPSVSDLPESPDCVILATGKNTVENLFDECIEKQVGGVIIYASGFSETKDEESSALQERLSRKAMESGVRLVGPNAIGFVNFESRAGATFLSGLGLEKGYERKPEELKIGLVSQSGALGLSLGQAMQRGIFFSHILACGNSSDVNVADCAEYLVANPSCRVVVCLLEGLENPRRLEEVIRKASSLNKPLIVCKMARGQDGARAAASHTGSLAGSHDAYRTMVERAGGLFVENYESVPEIAAFFAKAPCPSGDGAAVIATSGGAAILAADAAEAAGVPLPQPRPEVAEILSLRIPNFGSARNPCDVTAEVVNDIESLTVCVNAVMSQEDYGVIVVPHPLAYETASPRIALLNQLAAEAGKLICTVWLSGWLEGPGSNEIEESDHLALFRSMEHCFSTIALWTCWHKRQSAQQSQSVPQLSAAVHADVRSRMQSIDGTLIAERDAKDLLSQYGIPVIEEQQAKTSQEAREKSKALGFPLAMKIDSPDLPHKTEAGGLRLNLQSEEEVDRAFSDMMEQVRNYSQDARLDGVLLQRMAPKGVEIVVGAQMDPAFGPMIMVGLGGIFVELMRDSITAPAPVTPMEAEKMLRRLKGAKLLEGFRDLPPVDIAQLSRVVARVSEFASEQCGLIAELDINPIICRGNDIVAVDALLILNDRNT